MKYILRFSAKELTDFKFQGKEVKEGYNEFEVDRQFAMLWMGQPELYVSTQPFEGSGYIYDLELLIIKYDKPPEK